MQGAEDAPAAVAAVARTQLELVASGRHDVAFALMGGPLEAEARLAAERYHGLLLAELHPAVRALGFREPDAVLPFIASVVSAAVQKHQGGAPREETITAAVHFAVGGTQALRPSNGAADV